MLKKLRIKFIIVAMCATSLVLLSIITFINIHNYTDINRTADKTLELLKTNDGKFPIHGGGISDLPPKTDGGAGNPDQSAPTPPEQNAADPGGSANKSDKDKNENGNGNEIVNDIKKPLPGWMSPEMPYETRFFTVTIDKEDGDVEEINIDKIAAVSEDEAEEYAEKLFSDGKYSGFVGNYKYLAFDFGDDDEMMYIFLDCTKDLDTFREFLSASIFFSVAGLVIVFVLVVIFSGIIMRPFAKMYQKQKQFITDANHELKTPLTVISASCEILEYNTGENEWTDAIKEQVGHLTELTNKLVFLSRMDEENRKYTMTDFSLSEVAEEAIKPYYSLAEAAGRSLDCKIAPGLSLCGDMSMIKELLTLIFDNAIKYSSDGSEIRAELVPTGSGKNSRLTVFNDTDGIPKGDLDVIFERFYRLDKSRNSETGGHGIGLSVAKSIVEIHHGKISACSPDGKKFILTVTL